MFSKNMKSVLIITIIFVMSFVSVVLFADCEMMAMIAKKGDYISWENSTLGNWNDPYDYFQFMRDHSTSSSQDDGYGVIYYSDDETMYFNENNYFDASNQAWYKTNRNYSGQWVDNSTWYNDPNNHWQWNLIEPLDSYAEPTIMDNDTKATIILGHDRDGTGGSGNHPFRLEVNGKHYTFEHNGNVGNLKQTFYTRTGQLQPGWFSTNSSNWEGDPNSITDWIDSELYFHYILAYIETFDGDVIQGIYNALNDTSVDLIGSNSDANFILSDGFTVYAYRCSNSSSYNLEYEDHSDFLSIKTQDDSGANLSQDDLAILSPYGDIEIFNLDTYFPSYPFFSGTITQNTTWDNGLYITGDVIVPENVTLDIDATVYFLSHCNFIINGTVNLQDDSNFKLNHASEVLVENDGLLFLDWGSIVKGFTPTTVEATPPGQMVGGEPLIPGDRIIAKNGGVITTKTKTQYNNNPGPEITIASYSGDQWDGIYIQNPGDEDNFWFVNCDISGIGKISIENVGLSANNIAKLKLYRTDFHDAGGVIARDGHNLSIEGIATDLCYFEDTPAYPIYAYESPVELNYVHIEDNGGGIYLYDSSTPLSIINNCNILVNSGDGVRINGVAFGEFNENNIEDNTGFGMLCYPGTIFDNDEFTDITLSDNGYTEYAGWQNTFKMGNSSANITIEDSNYGSGSDQYLMMDILWDGINAVNIRGTNLTSSDLSHLSPSDPDAWTFSGGITPEEEMLCAAASDMGSDNYVLAEQTLQLLISDYPLTREAGSAVYYLYHLETLTDQDYSDLREYLENITPPTNSSLEMAIKKIITKTFMKEKEYLIAIDLFETVINNSQISDEVISAMIDEGYCYLKLADEGERGLPENCTVKTATLDEYQAKVRELESQFSFYPEEQDPNTTPVVGDILSVTNFPNPFNPTTTISFDLASESNVNITVYNVKGQEVKQLVSDQFTAGQHSIEWNGKDTNNKSVSSGIYFYQISAGESSAMRKMLLLK